MTLVTYLLSCTGGCDLHDILFCCSLHDMIAMNQAMSHTFLLLIACSKMDMDEIERWERNESPTKAMMELISHLPLHVENWFEEFVIVLKEHHYIDAVTALEPMLASASKSSDTLHFSAF